MPATMDSSAPVADASVSSDFKSCLIFLQLHPTQRQAHKSAARKNARSRARARARARARTRTRTRTRTHTYTHTSTEQKSVVRQLPRPHVPHGA